MIKTAQMDSIACTLKSKILRQFSNRFPRSLQGTPIRPPVIHFNNTDPYLLEALPESCCTPEFVERLARLNGKSLEEVAPIFENENTLLAWLKNIWTGASGKSRGFSEYELKNLYSKAFPNIKVPTDINCDAMIYLSNLEKNIGCRFDAHGIAKGPITDQLKILNDFLAKGIDKNRRFCTAPLVGAHGSGTGLGATEAYRDGSFILIGAKDKLIEESGIQHVIVNDAYYNIVNDLTKKFPNIKFVRADKACEYFRTL